MNTKLSNRNKHSFPNYASLGLIKHVNQL